MARDSEAKRIAADPGRLDLGSAPEGFDALVMADIVRARGGLNVFVARDGARASAFIDALAFFAPEIEILRFPSWDCLPYDRIGPSAGVAAQRMATLSLLARGLDAKPRLLVTQTPALLQRTPPREAVGRAAYLARHGQDVNIADLERYFAVNGYVRASTVSERGEFAIRGGVIDVFPSAADEPVRLDLFGDTLDSIRAFDPETQRSTRQLKAVDLLPVSEALLDAEAVSRFRKGYLATFGAPGDDAMYAAISEGHRRAGLEHFLPLFYERLETLFDYLPPGCLIGVDHLAAEARDERLAMIADAFDARSEAAQKGRYRALPATALYLSEQEWEQRLALHPNRRFSPFASEGAVDMGARLGRTFAAERAQDSVNLFEATADHARKLAGEGRRVLFASWSEGSSERLGTMLADHGLKGIAFAPYWQAAKANDPKKPQRVVLPLDAGFETDNLAVISETDILGDRLARPKKRRRAQNFLAEASALTPGDLVVHIDHGIGRYEGLKTLEVQEAPHDCLELHYAGEAKLYLPVENIDLLTRYGAESDGVQLDRLGGAAWQARKARAKERLREMADGLIQIAAARQLKHTDEVDPPHGLFDEFCARFPYEETDDQLNAIGDVLTDLSAGKPMDRLICGDVGFGKTEVALRAAFVAALNGVQVAVVVPTTLLSRQHYKTFSTRFQGLPVNVAQASRLVGAKELAENKKGIAEGQVDIVVGTHALLGQGIKFKNLGLLIIDEEQHFGVKHKERLKDLKSDVHVLTLSATPIPRTLQLALTGVRELSLITTPPVDRMAVRTFVSPFDPLVIRETLLRERYRGGQSFYVCPRISDLSEIKDFLDSQVPELKVAVAHGQMPPGELDDIMNAFYDGQYDVLLSTTIVESGLDIPTANTLIIHRADMFGLAQLYQLRGRVGRSKQRAFALFTLPANKMLTQMADRRLKVLQSLDTLGAGFQLASHDMDIRGAGNLLGEEQSGHIKEVGFELYQQMLEEAVAEIKGTGEVEDGHWSPQIAVGTAVMIPETYVPDLQLRLGLYRRLADLEELQDIDGFGAELIDRFGPLPDEVQHLLKIVYIKALCRRANVDKLDAGPKGIVIQFRNKTFSNPAALVKMIGEQGSMAKIRPDQSIVFVRDWPTAEKRLNGAAVVMTQLAKLAAA